MISREYLISEIEIKALKLELLTTYQINKIA